MRSDEVMSLAKGFAPVVVEFVARAVAPFSSRIKALEDRVPLKGDPGPPGEAKDGKDGIGLTDSHQDDRGHLILVYSDGRTKDVGKIRGESPELPAPLKGDPGPPGKDADQSRMEAISLRLDGVVSELASLRSQVASAKDGQVPASVKGDPGPPGKDADPTRIDALYARLDTLAAEVARLSGQVSAIEARPIPQKGDPGPPGKDADQSRLDALAAEVAKLSGQVAAVEARSLMQPQKGDPGPPGKDADAEALAALTANVFKLTEQVVEVRLSWAEQRAKVPQKGDPGPPGKDADLQVIETLKSGLEDLSTRLAGAIRLMAEDQTRITVINDEVKSVAGKATAAAVAKVEEVLRSHKFKVPSFVIDEKGDLLVAADDELVVIGRVRGKDGKDGSDGISVVSLKVDESGDLIVRTSDGKEEKAGHVVGQKGEPGADGFGFDDLSVVFDGERSFSFAFVKGDRKKEFGPFPVPHMIHRGVYAEGRQYLRGDAVTWGGSCWVAIKDTRSKPGERGNGDTGWLLAVKAGQPGKDGEKGDPGPPGKDFTPPRPSGFGVGRS